MNGLAAVAACLDSGMPPRAVCHCWGEPVIRPNSLVGSAANCKPRVLTDLATVEIWVSEAPNRRAASSSELKCRYSHDPAVAALAAAWRAPPLSWAATGRRRPRRPWAPAATPARRCCGTCTRTPAGTRRPRRQQHSHHEGASREGTNPTGRSQWRSSRPGQHLADEP